MRPQRVQGGWPRRGPDYLKVGLMREGVRVWVFVQRLVLLTFVGPPPEGCTDAAHRNHVSTDNRLSNLRWKTHDENVAEMADAAERRAVVEEACGAVPAGRADPPGGAPF